MNDFLFKFVLEALSIRSLVFLTLLCNFSLFLYAIIFPDYIRFAVALAFSVSVFIPVLRKGNPNVQGTIQKAVSSERPME
jgi:hypothetical protein